LILTNSIGYPLIGYYHLLLTKVSKIILGLALILGYSKKSSKVVSLILRSRHNVRIKSLSKNPKVI
jgi:hypothetical protein